MRKKILIILIIVLIFLVAIFGINCLREHAIQSGSLEGYDVFGDIISVGKWNDYGNSQRVIRVKVTDKEISNGTTPVTYFSSGESMAEIIGHNEKFYVGPDTIYDSGIKKEAELFFVDNNYYALVYDENNKLPYGLYNCCSISDFTGDSILIPMPVISFLSEKSIDSMRKEFNKNYLWEDIYKWWSFEQAVSFYKRLDSKYVKTDEKKQTIEVRVYAHSYPNQFTPFRFDFAKKTVSVKDKKGKWKLYDGRG